MADFFQEELFGPAVPGDDGAQKEHAMGLGISFNGCQYIFRDGRYDRLADAIAYAEQDIHHEWRRVAASTPAQWRERPVPGLVDQKLMAEYDISFEEWRYRYRGYRYDRLSDAVNYARSTRGAG